MTGYARAVENFEQLTRSGGPLHFGLDRSRLLLRLLRTLGRGRPVPVDEAMRTSSELGVALPHAHRVLEQMAERDADGNIVGLMGLTLNETRHRFSVNGTQMSAWCAQDALFLPVLLNASAIIESTSPLTKARIRLTVSPQKVETIDPPGTVVSMAIVDPGAANVNSVAAIWQLFCHHIFFFASRQEAAQWATGRENIEILSVDEAFELGRQVTSKILADG